MPTSVTMACLANSRKWNGRCIAGRVMQANGVAGPWVRPVVLRPNRSVFDAERKLASGQFFDVLDIVSYDETGAHPQHYHTEDRSFDVATPWRWVGRLTAAGLDALVDTAHGLWVNGQHTYHGLNDKIPQFLVGGVNSSLALIKPSPVAIRVIKESKFGGGETREIRADFNWLGNRYYIKVTDPWIEQRYAAHPTYVERFEFAWLCVSLGEPMQNGDAIKLVAAVIIPGRV